MIEEIQTRRDDFSAVNYGLKESVSTVDREFNHLIKSQNFRLSKDGSRLEKRNGLTLQATITGGYPVYGYTTYYNATPVFCELAVTSKAIWRKVGAGAWTSIYTWASDITHPVKIFEAQDKIYVMTEVGNRVILSDGTVAQVGITPPATAPTVAASYDATLLNETFANVTAWTDADAVSGASSQATFDSKSCLKLLAAAATGSYARRYLTTGIDVGDIFVVELDAYFHTLGIYPKVNHFQLTVNNGMISFQVRIDKNDIYINDGGHWAGVMATINVDSVWTKLKFLVDSSTPGEEHCEIFQDGISLGEFLCGNRSDLYPGRVGLIAYGNSLATEVYLDNIIVSGITGGMVNGLRRFAVTYIRDGNYPCESNPIRSTIGAVTQVGAGLNDLSITGEYTGTYPMTIRVEAQAGNTFRYSFDNGLTWAGSLIPMALATSIDYGIILNFAAITGHTTGDYWYFTCSAISVDACRQRCTLTSIPVSTDAQVTKKGIYVTMAGGYDYYLCGEIANARTSFEFNMPDEALGRVLEDDRDIAPLGKTACYWDDRIWTLDTTNSIVYYSEINRLEEFDAATRWIAVKQGDSHDKPTMMIVYGGILYVFKHTSILKITKKTGGGYGRYEIPLGGIGAVAGWSVQEVGGLLTFLSDRGYEAFNGESLYDQDFFAAVNRSVDYWNRTYPDTICAAHHQQKNELLVSFPYRTVDAVNIPVTISLNYITGNFFPFSYAYTPTVFTRAKDSGGTTKTYMGTTTGLVLIVDEGTADNGTAITAYARTNWRREEVARNWRRFECEYEAPTSMDITVNFYVDFDKDVAATRTLAGKTPTSTDIELRRPINSHSEIALKGQFISVEFTNALAVGDALKINQMLLISADKNRKDTVSPD
jgi:hypothetical protein